MGDISKLPKETHLPMIEEYCNNYGNQFLVGNQEDVSEFYIQVAASIANNNDKFLDENYTIKLYLGCLECDKCSETSENNNKCLYLGLNNSKANGNLTVMDQ